MSVPERFPGIRIAPPDERGILLYDDDCGFCRKWAAWFQTHAKRPVAVEPVQSHLQTLPPQAAVTAAHQVLWINPQGEIHGGSQAIIAALKATGHRLQSALLQAAQPLTRYAYQQIARHRSSAPSCSLKAARRRCSPVSPNTTSPPPKTADVDTAERPRPRDAT